MAKQKAAPGKKASKTKTERTGSAKAASAANKRPGPAAKAAPSKTQTTTSTVAKKKSTPAPTPAKKAAPLKAAAKTPKLKEAPAARATVQRKPPEKAAKPVSRPTAEVSPKKDDSSRTSKPVAVSEKAKPASKAPVGKRMSQKAVAAKASNAAATAIKPAPRILGNGQLAGVLQAARSVASKTNKVVEVEKERKSHLTAEELAEFRQILLDKRRELVDDMVNLEDEARRTGSEGGPGSSVMPIHMADLGSDTWEQEFTLNLIEKERTIVREIDEALDRIEKRTYGTCLATGKSISKARLRVKPWAKYCIEYARKRELGLT